MSDIEIAKLVENQTETRRQVEDIYIPEEQPSPITPFMSLPGLVGLWYPGNVQRSTGNIYDYSGQGRTLTYNGNPTINYLSNGIAYADLDGTGDYWSRADETDLDILGTESWASNQGLTLGCWFWVDGGAGTNRALMSKAINATNQISYYMLVGTGNTLSFAYSTDGALGAGSSESIVSSNTVTTGGWHFGIARWTPSTERSVFLNGTKTQTSSSAFASLFNSTSAFEIGRLFTTILLDGRISVSFLCANAIPDATIQSLFEQTRSLYGV